MRAIWREWCRGGFDRRQYVQLRKMHTREFPEHIVVCCRWGFRRGRGLGAHARSRVRERNMVYVYGGIDNYMVHPVCAAGAPSINSAPPRVIYLSERRGPFLAAGPIFPSSHGVYLLLPFFSLWLRGKGKVEHNTFAIDVTQFTRALLKITACSALTFYAA